MYLEYYDLKEKPFAITPDPDFIYMNDKFRQGFNEVVYAVHNRLGLAVIIGEVGTGKTTLARAILRELRNRCRTAYIINPALSFEELVSTMLRDLGETDLPTGREALLSRLNEFLLDAYHQGETVVVFVDEAHLLAEEELEKVRLLSNLETNKEKLLQMVLIGQPELGRILSKRSMRQLRDRIVVQVGLEPFKPSEVCDYIYHRLSLAGDAGALTFTPRACKKIATLSGGIPRRINLLCDRALLAAYARRTFEVTPKLVKDAAKDIHREFPQEIVRKERRGIGWSGWVLVFLVLCIGGVFYINQVFFGYSPKDLMRELLSVGKSVPQVIKAEEKAVKRPPGVAPTGAPSVSGKEVEASGAVGNQETQTAPVAKEPGVHPEPASPRTKGQKTAKEKVGHKKTKNVAVTGKSAGNEGLKEKTTVRPKSTQNVNSNAASGNTVKKPAVAKKPRGGSKSASKVVSSTKDENRKVVASPQEKKTSQNKVAKMQKPAHVSKELPISTSAAVHKASVPVVMREPILSPETEKAIEAQVDRWKVAMENLDEPALKKMYDPSLYTELESRLSLMRAGGEERDIRIENLEIIPLISGDVKATFEQQYLSMRYSDYGLTTLVFRRKGGRWVIVGYQWKSL